MADFNDCIEAIGLDDIRVIGPTFTWWNCQEENSIFKKLHRAVGNSSWLCSMLDSHVFFGHRGLSDHCPIILNIGLHLYKVKKPFQFFNYMIDLVGFTDSVHEVWNVQVFGNPMIILSEKLRELKRPSSLLMLILGIFLQMSLLSNPRSTLLNPLFIMTYITQP